MPKNDFQSLSGINPELTKISNWFFRCELHALGNEITLFIPSDCVTFHNICSLLIRSGVEVVVKELVEKEV